MSVEPMLCVVVHDVAESTLEACDRLLRAVDAVAPVPVTFLAVPRYHHDAATPRVERWLDARSQCGDEIALHGWSHLDETAPRNPVDRLRRRTYTRSEGEFWALDAAEAARRIEFGVEWFARHGWPLRGFVAPAWLLGAGGWEAVRAGPFDYTSTLRRIHLLPGDAHITCQSIVYSTSSAWRRVASVVWAGAVARSLRTDPVMRLELHPRDADHPGVRRSWQRVLAAALQRRRAVTVAELTDCWRKSLPIATTMAVERDTDLRAD